MPPLGWLAIDLSLHWYRSRHPDAFERPVTRRHRRWIFPLLIAETVLALAIVPWFVLPTTWGAPLPLATLVALSSVAVVLTAALIATWRYLDSEDDPSKAGPL